LIRPGSCAVKKRKRKERETMFWSVHRAGRSRPEDSRVWGKRGGVPPTLMSVYRKAGEKTSRNWKQGVNFL